MFVRFLCFFASFSPTRASSSDDSFVLSTFSSCWPTLRDLPSLLDALRREIVPRLRRPFLRSFSTPIWGKNRRFRRFKQNLRANSSILGFHHFFFFQFLMRKNYFCFDFSNSLRMIPKIITNSIYRGVSTQFVQIRTRKILRHFSQSFDIYVRIRRLVHEYQTQNLQTLFFVLENKATLKKWIFRNYVNFLGSHGILWNLFERNFAPVENMKKTSRPTGRPTWKVAGIRRRIALSRSWGLFVAPIIITVHVGSVINPSHKDMNWAFIIAVASWSVELRALKNESIEELKKLRCSDFYFF